MVLCNCVENSRRRCTAALRNFSMSASPQQLSSIPDLQALLMSCFEAYDRISAWEDALQDQVVVARFITVLQKSCILWTPHSSDVRRRACPLPLL